MVSQLLYAAFTAIQKGLVEDSMGWTLKLNQQLYHLTDLHDTYFCFINKTERSYFRSGCFLLAFSNNSAVLPFPELLFTMVPDKTSRATSRAARVVHHGT